MIQGVTTEDVSRNAAVADETFGCNISLIHHGVLAQILNSLLIFYFILRNALPLFNNDFCYSCCAVAESGVQQNANSVRLSKVPQLTLLI